MPNDLDLVCVQHCYGMDVAEIYKSKLEAMDIPVLLEFESAGKLFGLTIDGLGEVRVMVPRDYAGEAEALLAEEMPVEDVEEVEVPVDEEEPAAGIEAGVEAGTS